MTVPKPICLNPTGRRRRCPRPVAGRATPSGNIYPTPSLENATHHEGSQS
jgi:hypothetical protein